MLKIGQIVNIFIMRADKVPEICYVSEIRGMEIHVVSLITGVMYITYENLISPITKIQILGKNKKESSIQLENDCINYEIWLLLRGLSGVEYLRVTSEHPQTKKEIVKDIRVKLDKLI